MSRGKKLEPHEAFEVLRKGQADEVVEIIQPEDIEGGFGEQAEAGIQSQPVWKRYLLRGVLVFISCVVVSGVAAFYWFLTQHAEPEVVEKPPLPQRLAAIGEEEAKKIIEASLRAFLVAESNEERLRYVYDASDEQPSLEIYYNKRRVLESPLWKIERLERMTSVQGEIWFVVYRDLKGGRHTVSFQRYEDGYLLHWSAMKAFGEMTWEKFLVKRPASPVLMRGYLRHYDGVWPLGISPDDFHCFLMEDRAGLFSELVVMKSKSLGYITLKALSQSSRHPVTLELAYRPLSSGVKMLHIISLKHLRWQRMAMDSRLE